MLTLVLTCVPVAQELAMGPDVAALDYSPACGGRTCSLGTSRTSPGIQQVPGHTGGAGPAPRAVGSRTPADAENEGS